MKSKRNMEPMMDAEPALEADSDEAVFDSAEPAPDDGGRKGIMLQLGLKLKELTVTGLRALARALKLGPTPPAAFADCKITDVQLEAGAKAVEDQETEVKKADDAATAQRNLLAQKVQALEELVTAAATDRLNAVSTLPEAEARNLLQEAHVPLRAEREASPPAQRPTNFFVNRGDHDGAVDGGCDRDKNAKMYRVRGGQNPNGPFEMKYEGTRSSFSLVNQPAGETWYQMAAFGVNGGWSEWSDPARCVVI